MKTQLQGAVHKKPKAQKEKSKYFVLNKANYRIWDDDRKEERKEKGEKKEKKGGGNLRLLTKT